MGYSDLEVKILPEDPGHVWFWVKISEAKTLTIVWTQESWLVTSATIELWALTVGERVRIEFTAQESSRLGGSEQKEIVKSRTEVKATNCCWRLRILWPTLRTPRWWSSVAAASGCFLFLFSASALICSEIGATTRKSRRGAEGYHGRRGSLKSMELG